ncbi:MFS transporter [Anaeromyxobacter soli]|uniref:MFS transporter n=1 Tax=Anaeromyxobacter soli TaxID=2922725 RepID=UPI001FAF40D1|nr:MFS transporter [Anaeromyxobacter sp. SG29]
MRAPRAESRLPARPAARAAALLALVHALPLLDRAAFGAVLERMRADLWLTDLQLGLAASVPALALGVLALRPARAPARRIRGVLSAALWSAAGALAWASRGAGTLLLSRAAAGAASAAAAPARQSPREGEETLPGGGALVTTAVALAALGYAGAGALGWRLGWRAALVASAATSLLATVTLSRGAVAAAPSALPRHPAFRRALAGGALVAFAAGALATWAPAFLERARGVPRAISPLETGAAVLMAGAAAAWGRGVLAEALRRAGASRWLCPGAALAAAPLALGALLARRPVAYLAALVTAIALVLVALAALREALARTLPADRRGAATGALLLVALLGDAPAALVVGAVSHRTSLWWAMLLVPAALLAGGVLLAQAARRPGGGPGEEAGRR